MTGITDEEWQKMTVEERAEYQIKNCIFCKIIKGEIPSKKMYEDEHFVGILDINPASKGHILLLPKTHAQIFPQLGTETMGHLGIVAKTLSEKVKHATGANSTTIFIANGAVAGQNAPHAMMHIIPRKKGDEIQLNPELKETPKTKIEELQQKFVKALGLPPITQKEETETTKENLTEETENEKIKHLETDTQTEEQEIKESEENVEEAEGEEAETEREKAEDEEREEKKQELKEEDTQKNKNILDKIKDLFD